MSYDKLPPTRYNLGLFDFGGGSDRVGYVRGPLGKAGMLYDYGVYDVQEVFAAGTATPMMSVGTAADPDHYGNEFDFGALTVASGGKSVLSTYRPTEANYLTTMLIRTLPADTAVYFSLIAGTGSGLTGQAYAFLEIVWDD